MTRLGPRARLAGTLLLASAGAALSADAVAAEAELAWDPVPDILGYKVYYDTDSGDPYLGDDATEGASPIDVPLALLSDPNAPTFTVTGLDSCTVYYFAVTAYNAEDESVYSGEVYATVLARPQPVGVTGGGPGAMEVSWPPLPSDDDGTIPRFILHWDTTTHADWEMPNDPPYGAPYLGAGSPLWVETTALDDPSAPAVVVTGLTDQTTYYVRVEATCDDGRSKFSEEYSGMSGETSGGGSGTGGSGSGNSGTGGSGNAGTGGSATGGSGTGGSSVGGAPLGDDDDDGSEEEGCGCSTPGRAGARSLGALGALAGLAIGVARRARRRRQAR